MGCFLKIKTLYLYGFPTTIRLPPPARFYGRVALGEGLQINCDRDLTTKFSTQVKPINKLKSHDTEIFKNITENREPMSINQKGEIKQVVIDVRNFDEQEETLALLKTLELGNLDIEQGKFSDAEDVFAELDTLIINGF
ncbi:hypothetical protein ACO0K7_01940 [Undibacterium sp. Ji67W]